jgi:hypothetical protein
VSTSRCVHFVDHACIALTCAQPAAAASHTSLHARYARSMRLAVARKFRPRRFATEVTDFEDTMLPSSGAYIIVCKVTQHTLCIVKYTLAYSSTRIVDPEGLGPFSKEVTVRPLPPIGRSPYESSCISARTALRRTHSKSTRVRCISVSYGVASVPCAAPSACARLIAPPRVHRRTCAC